jgi:hypothetical protein
MGDCREGQSIRACLGIPLLEKQKKKKTPWPESASEHRLSAKFVPNFVDRGCRVVSATDLHGRILVF